MKNNHEEVAEAPGADITKKTFTIEQVESFVKKDLSTAIHLLDAIYRDENTLHQVALFLHGRWENARHQEDLKKQTKLDI